MAAQSSTESPEHLHDVLKALAEPRRLAILRLVREHELPAGEISSHFGTTRQAISQHLRVLTEVGLLDLRRQGTKRLYRVRSEAFRELWEFLSDFWDDRLASLKRQVEGDLGARRDG
jgi:DNA-binding transcriptional ArsR family regulator